MNDPIEQKLARLRAATEALDAPASFAARMEEHVGAERGWSLFVSAGRRFAMGALAIAVLAVGVSELADSTSASAFESAVSFEMDVESPW